MSNKLEQQEAKHHCFLMHKSYGHGVNTYKERVQLGFEHYLQNLRETLEQSTITKCDKQNAIPLTINPKCHVYTKHMLPFIWENERR